MYKPLPLNTYLLKAYNIAVVVYLLSHPTLATPLSVAHQAPLIMEFPRQAYWSG